MDRFLERLKQPKLTQEETDNLNNPRVTEEIGFVIKNFPTKKTPDPGGFTGEFYQTFKWEIKPIVHKLFQKNKEERLLFFFLIYFYLFIFGCIGSSFLCEGFL